MKINNHFLPRFHIKKWDDLGGKIHNKTTNKTRKIYRYDFSKKKYYQTQGTDELENRISRFESYIANIILLIDNSEESIELTGKQLFLLKLYCAFCSYRQQFTSEVIIEDDFAMYKSNNYLWGVKRYTEKKDILFMTEEIIKVFELVEKDDTFRHLEEFSPILTISKMLSLGNPDLAMYGIHLSIIRSNENWMCISERCAIIENTLDSDYLFTYVPVSPKTALLLVKTKYYRDLKTYNDSRARLSYKNGGSRPDPYLSVIFGSCARENYDSSLFCSYYKPFVRSNVHAEENYLPNVDYSKVVIKINIIPRSIIDNFNAIFYQDGSKFLYLHDLQLKIASCIDTDYRHIKLNF
ncbi:DUF4238 domain-containing protein [Acholeplasma manati]|uniref:DUF4238 domain-containing protein n=1 Tax=Paracholeplasma manati TaxID=591373 RepID=A0ABT2Y3B2_9MOLU|nr:DUF4238 domain-containing protein [Paracholeplasma manati]MCV2231222.1 DUF4238 domain-containing protein [Paracholeplasma manati]